MEKNKKLIKEIIIYAIILVIVILIRLFVITPVRVDGNSMETTLHDGEIMLLNKIGYRFNKIKRFDIIVLNYNNERLIKRVVALPNETVEYLNNKLYVNGEVVEDNSTDQVTQDFFQVQLKENEYFVLGDNRNDSLDSRVFGAINKNKILGKAEIVLFPFSHFGIKK